MADQELPIPDDALPVGGGYVDTAGELIASDLIEKVNAGAALVHALYHLPLATVRALLDNSSPGFRAIYDHAQTAYGFEDHE